MVSIKRETYELLLSKNPCEIFDYFKVKEMHGLNITDSHCQYVMNNQ